MLSRTAENLFWTGRYMERADSTARLVEMGLRMAMLPGGRNREEWRSVAAACGRLDAFAEDREIDERAVIQRLVLDPDNPSSIRACVERARTNARAVRTALTQEMWEAINDGWRKLESLTVAEASRDLPALLDWVKARAALFRGTAGSSMLRNDGYTFLRLGLVIERSDMTLRLLDVKYYVLLPETEVVGGGRDHHQWTSVLHATSALRAYHHVYRGDYSPWNIADFLILNRSFPRSVSYSSAQVTIYLDRLATDYGEEHDCHRTAREISERLRTTGMGELFQTGLHQFVRDSIANTTRLTAEIYRAYHF